MNDMKGTADDVLMRDMGIVPGRHSISASTNYPKQAGHRVCKRFLIVASVMPDP